MSNWYSSAHWIAGKLGACQEGDTIVIAGAPRSGTTLIQEALQELPDYKAVNEPLLKAGTQARYGFSSRTFIAPGTEAPTQREFLHRSLTGQLGADARWVFHAQDAWGRLREHGRKRQLIVKFCRINRMMQWFAEQFNPRGIVFVVRHPCSVVSSMLHYGQWKRDYTAGNLQEPGSPLALADLPEQTRALFEPIVANIRSQAEGLAAVWCLDHYIPLCQYRDHPWIMLPYERLVREGQAELDRVARGLNVEVNDDMVRLLGEPSSSVKGELDRDVETQLSKWKRNLSADEITTILRVVDQTGLSRFYTDSIEPDYDALNTYQLDRYRWSPLVARV